MTTRSELPLTERLAATELFADLDEQQLEWLMRTGHRRTLDDGEVLFHEGDTRREFYVVLAGEMTVTVSSDGRDQVVGSHSAVLGANPENDEPAAAVQFVGELPLLAGGRQGGTVTADGPVELFGLDQAAFSSMLELCPRVARVLLPVVAWRIHEREVRDERTAMLDGLGTLAAGLAHELNNPMAAAVRSACELRFVLGDLLTWAGRWGALATSDEQDYLATLLVDRDQGKNDARPDEDDARPDVATATAGADGPGGGADDATGTPGLKMADAADEIEGWMAEQEIDELGHGEVLAEQGIGVSMLARVADHVRPEALGTAIGLLGFTHYARALLDDVIEAGGRTDSLVQATKSYTNLGRSPERDVDVHEGLRDTLAVEAAVLDGVEVHCHFADLPAVPAFPMELNQVWSHLLRNAAAAVGADGEIDISTRQVGDFVVVEIRDNGSGIDPELLTHLFQPFFSTKAEGEGPGLGLHLCRDIVVNRHGGTIDVTSCPGDTRFTVQIPVTSPDGHDG